MKKKRFDPEKTIYAVVAIGCFFVLWWFLTTFTPVKNTTPDLETNRRGCFVVDEWMHTSKEAVWAGGDAVTGAATVISAMGAGKKAAAAICDYLAQK